MNNTIPKNKNIKIYKTNNKTPVKSYKNFKKKNLLMKKPLKKITKTYQYLMKIF